MIELESETREDPTGCGENDVNRNARSTKNRRSVDDETGNSESRAEDNESGTRCEFSYKNSWFDQVKDASWQDAGILTFGALLPAGLIACYVIACSDRIVKMIVKHPVETLIECALVALIPVSTYLIWKAKRGDDGRFALRRGMLNGLSIGTSAIITGILATSLGLGYPVVDSYSGQSHAGVFTFMMIISSLALCIAVCQANQLRLMRALRSARLRQTTFSVVGALLAVLAFAGAEARSVMIRIAEQMAISHNNLERQRGLKMLSELDAKRDLIIDGSDPRSAGLPGLFVKIDPEQIRQLYFSVVGERYRCEHEENLAVVSADYLQKHVVGAPIAGLSLLRSSLTGTAHARTLSSTVNWTFVFSNDSLTNQEARAELGLPEGAVITGITSWIDGKKYAGKFFASGAAEASDGSSGYLSLDHQEPAIVTDLGRSRYLMHCYPIASRSEVKVQLTVVVPMTVAGVNDATLALPRLISSNFEVKGEHQLTLRSGKGVKLEVQNGTLRKLATGGHSLARSIDDKELTGGLLIGANDEAGFEPIAAADPFSTTKRYLVQSINQIHSDAPKNLVVVVDASKGMEKQLDEIKSAMKKLPSTINASFILAGEDSKPVAVPLTAGLDSLKSPSLRGGQDNLQALVQAADLAGSDVGGAVLWIHGAQPAYSKEIYLMAPFVAKPKVYEIAVDNGETDVREFIKNHEEVGPITSIARTGTIRSDLERFLNHWRAGDVQTRTALKESNNIAGMPMADPEEAAEMAALWANQECNNLLNQPDKAVAAASVAVSHHIVTPVSLAGVLQAQRQQRVAREQASAPELQGAINGTIGPQGSDATVIQGVNTAGTVRVNNLANLEAMLNIFANSVQILALAFGGSLIVFGGMNGRYGRLASGIVIAAGGLSAPGIINWLVASCRDANLFS
jgi:hypothetical protein